jgi:mono/diheme cytochrome c family protein
MACHGDDLAGNGYFAHGFNPAPIDFTNAGTLPQLTESFVFWRIAKGGPGLPREGRPWNSAMPAWEDVLTEEEIWSVIVYLYRRRMRSRGRGTRKEASIERDAGWSPPLPPHCSAPPPRLCTARSMRASRLRPVVRRMPRRGRPRRRAGRRVHAAATARLHAGALPDPHYGQRRAADRRRHPARHRERHARHRDAGLAEADTAREDASIDYLKTFSTFFETEAAPQPLAIGRAPRASTEAIEEGRQLYDQLECWKCHGRAGRGDGPSAPTLEDDSGMPIRPADLTQNWRFNGGGTVQDIHMRLRTGLDGTPMPSSSDLLEANVSPRRSSGTSRTTCAACRRSAARAARDHSCRAA